MGSGPDIARTRPARYFFCEQVHKRFPRDAGGGLQNAALGLRHGGAFREEAPPFFALTAGATQPARMLALR